MSTFNRVSVEFVLKIIIKLSAVYPLTYYYAKICFLQSVIRNLEFHPGIFRQFETQMRTSQVFTSFLIIFYNRFIVMFHKVRAQHEISLRYMYRSKELMIPFGVLSVPSFKLQIDRSFLQGYHPTDTTTTRSKRFIFLTFNSNRNSTS